MTAAAQSLLQPCTGSANRDCKHGRGANGCEDCRVRLFSVCGALDSSELDELDRISQRKNYPAKTTLFEQGALAGSVSTSPKVSCGSTSRCRMVAGRSSVSRCLVIFWGS